MTEEKWSKGVTVHRGALERHGWKENESGDARHAALERSVRADGYKTTIDRLDFLSNVANLKDNEALATTAADDRLWLERWERDQREDEDRRREHGDKHHVDGYTKDDGERVRPHLARNPRGR
ncbi:MAG: hypothetical protein ACYDDZ_06650 [Acidimicrobiales bacterium]